MEEVKFLTWEGLGIYDSEVKSFIAAKIAAANHLRFVKVDALPAVAEADERAIYLLARNAAGQKTADVYDEYFLIDGQFELIGNTTVDFSEVEASIEALNGLVAGLQTSKLDGATGDDYVSAAKSGTSVNVAATDALKGAVNNANSAVQSMTVLGHELTKTSNTLTVETAKSDLGLVDAEGNVTYDAAGAAAGILGAAADEKTANTVYGAKALANANKADVIGQATDLASADTIYGAKKYADAAVEGVSSKIKTISEAEIKSLFPSATV